MFFQELIEIDLLTLILKLKRNEMYILNSKSPQITHYNFKKILKIKIETAVFCFCDSQTFEILINSVRETNLLFNHVVKNMTLLL